MARYVAFLRAINVGGRYVRMERLRTAFTDAGFANVETFITSGNVIFDTRGTNTTTLERKIERALQTDLGYAVGTFVRTLPELSDVARHDPFPDESTGGKHTVHVGFLKEAPSAAACKLVVSLSTDVDRLHVHGRELYWLVRGSLLDSKVPEAQLGRAVGQMTMRNRNTVTRLATKYCTQP